MDKMIPMSKSKSGEHVLSCFTHRRPLRFWVIRRSHNSANIGVSTAKWAICAFGAYCIQHIPIYSTN